MKIDEKQIQRYKFLQTLYELVDGNSNYIINLNEINNLLQWDDDAIHNVYHYLHEEGLVEGRTLGGNISITHKGIIEYEATQNIPEKSTEHFSSNIYNILNIQNVNNSQIQQGTERSSQKQTNITQENKSILEILDKLKSEIESKEKEMREIDQEKYDALQDDILILKEEISKQSVDNFRVQRFKKNIANVVISVFGSIIAYPIIELLKKFFYN